MATHREIKECDSSQETWTTYIEHLEFYFITNGNDNPGKKWTVLLTVIGPTIYKDVLAPQKQVEKSYDELVALVKSHNTLKPSDITQRF